MLKASSKLIPKNDEIRHHSIYLKHLTKETVFAVCANNQLKKIPIINTSETTVSSKYCLKEIIELSGELKATTFCGSIQENFDKKKIVLKTLS